MWVSWSLQLTFHTDCMGGLCLSVIILLAYQANQMQHTALLICTYDCGQGLRLQNLHC